MVQIHLLKPISCQSYHQIHLKWFSDFCDIDSGWELCHQCGNVSEIMTWITKINESYCPLETCKATDMTIFSNTNDIKAIKDNILNINNTKCSSETCQKTTQELHNFGKITDSLYSTQEDLISSIHEIKETSCPRKGKKVIIIFELGYHYHTVNHRQNI